MVVLCDAYYMPIKQISIEHAVQLLVLGKAEPIYGNDGLKVIAKLGLAQTAIENWGNKFKSLIEDGKFLIPAGIRLIKQIGFRIQSLRPTRTSIFRRDKFCCQYCGTKNSLTIDHVVPRSKGGQNTWENLVTACIPCNNSKGSRSLEEANMKLVKEPQPWMPKVTMDLLAKIIGFEV